LPRGISGRTLAGGRVHKLEGHPADATSHSNAESRIAASPSIPHGPEGGCLTCAITQTPTEDVYIDMLRTSSGTRMSSRLSTLFLSPWTRGTVLPLVQRMRLTRGRPSAPPRAVRPCVRASSAILKPAFTDRYPSGRLRAQIRHATPDRPVSCRALGSHPHRPVI